MRIALTELRRQPRRFVAATAILSMLAALLMLLGGLLDGLTAEAVDAIRGQRADLLVFSAESDSQFGQSRIDREVRRAAQAVDGVAEVGGLGVIQLGSRLPGKGPRDLVAVSVFGYELPPVGVPDPPPDGQVYADESLRSDGVEVGTIIPLGPGGSNVTVVGFTPPIPYRFGPTLWANVDTWRSVLGENRPGASLADGVTQALALDVEGDPEEIAAAIDRRTGSTRTLTPEGVIEADVAVQSQDSTFKGIIATTVAVAIVVVALFFALLTIERTALYGVLKAIGARSSTLFGGVIAQAVLLTVIASLIGAGASVLLATLIPSGTVPIALSGGRVVTSAALLLVAAVLGCAFSLRRVLRIDPASAIGGTT